MITVITEVGTQILRLPSEADNHFFCLDLFFEMSYNEIAGKYSSLSNHDLS